jgi:hypothetical protein
MQSLPRIAAACLAAAAFALGALPRAQAATMYYADVERLTHISDLVVVGRIASTEVYLGNEGRITTRWTVSVSETLVGSHHDTISFTQWAGELDGVAQRVPGDARLNVGDDVVLFLHGTAPDELSLSALGQASWSIVPTPSRIDLPTTPLVRQRVADGMLSLGDVGLRLAGATIQVPIRWVERDLAGVEVYDHTTGEVHEAEGTTAMPLPELIHRVRLAASTREGAE